MNTRGRGDPGLQPTTRPGAWVDPRRPRHARSRHLDRRRAARLTINLAAAIPPRPTHRVDALQGASHAPVPAGRRLLAPAAGRQPGRGRARWRGPHHRADEHVHALDQPVGGNLPAAADATLRRTTACASSMPPASSTSRATPRSGSCHAWLRAGGMPRTAGLIVQECPAGLIAHPRRRRSPRLRGSSRRGARAQSTSRAGALRRPASWASTGSDVVDRQLGRQWTGLGGRDARRRPTRSWRCDPAPTMATASTSAWWARTRRRRVRLRGPRVLQQ